MQEERPQTQRKRKTFYMKMDDFMSPEEVEQKRKELERGKAKSNAPIEGSLLNALEEVEEEALPEYHVAGSAVVNDEGQVVDQSQLIRDYKRLQTEVLRLEELSKQLVKSTRQTDMRLVQTVRIEKTKRKRLALALSIGLTVIGIVAVGIVLVLKNAKEEQILATVDQERQEKQKIGDLLKKNEEEAKKIMESLQEKHNLEKEALANRLQLEKEKELAALKDQATTGTLGKGMSEEDKKLMLAKMEQDLRSKYDAKESSQLKVLADQMQKEREARTQQMAKMTTILQQMEKEKLEMTQIKEAKAAQDKLKQSESVKDELAKTLTSNKDELANMQREMAQLREKLAIKAAQPVSQPTTQPIKTVTEPVQPTTPKVDKDSLELSKKTDPKTIMDAYYQQKLVETESVDVNFSSEEGNIAFTVHYRHDHNQKTTKELIKITAPKSMEGTNYLGMIDRNTGERTVWKYDPVKQRVNRIPGNQRAQAILNSEFTYEDWITENEALYKYGYMKADELLGRPTHIVLVEPKTEEETNSSQYLKKYYWLDSEILIPLQIKYFSKDNQLSKIQVLKKMVRIDKQYWRPEAAIMINAKTKRKTTASFSNWRINQRLADDMFSLQALSK